MKYTSILCLHISIKIKINQCSWAFEIKIRKYKIYFTNEACFCLAHISKLISVFIGSLFTKLHYSYIIQS
jgi:putative Mn2+ efflux pump MntP